MQNRGDKFNIGGNLVFSPNSLGNIGLEKNKRNVHKHYCSEQYDSNVVMTTRKDPKRDRKRCPLNREFAKDPKTTVKIP